MREGLAGLLTQAGFAVVGRADTPATVLQLAAAQTPDVIVLDLMLGAADGLALIKDLTSHAPLARVLVFTLQPEAVYAERCLRAGARGYVMKNEPVDELFAAIRAVATGGMRFSPRVTLAVLEAAQGGAAKTGGIAQLTDRELQVFRLTGLAMPTRAVAEKLGVSVKTVEAHRENIKNKLGVQTHTELTARAAAWLRETAQG